MPVKSKIAGQHIIKVSHTKSANFPHDHSKKPSTKNLNSRLLLIHFISYVALFGEVAIADRLNRHPTKGKSSRRFLRIDAVVVNDSRQSEIRHFDEFVLQDENVSTSQVAMNETLPSQIFLIDTLGLPLLR